jgi:hypothetical protein
MIRIESRLNGKAAAALKTNLYRCVVVEVLSAKVAVHYTAPSALR